MGDTILGVTITVGLGLYFLPTIIATVRRAKRLATIFAVNIIVGWTVVGWIATLIWVTERHSEAGDLARPSPMETDTWSFDRTKSSEVAPNDHWVLGNHGGYIG